MATDQSQAEISFREALWVWVRVAALSFGGPAGQIAVMHRILVEEKKWISEDHFLHALNYCMLLPGPEAQQLAIYNGWLLHKIKGGLVAGILFILPGFFSILALSFLYVLYGNLVGVEGLFLGLKAAVLAIVTQALFRLGKRALKNLVFVGLAFASFAAIFFFDLAFPWIIASAAIIGWLGTRILPKYFNSNVVTPLGIAAARPSWKWSLKVAGIFLFLWFAPLAALASLLGRDHVMTELGVFFSQMAVVTFGGAYAVLAYVAQEAVQNYGWLRPGEMLDGLGMAETTPGPLIQVVQFIGFMAAYRDPGGIPPLLAATWGSVLVTWVTFVPCFLWIFLGAPFVESLRSHRGLNGALSGITAAVVGVIANLALWFSIHTLFQQVETWNMGILHFDLPLLHSLSLPAFLLTVLAFVVLFAFRQGMILTILVCSLAGVLSSWI